MNAGDMDRRVIIEQASLAQDSSGELIPTWSTLATVWAEVVPMRVDEAFRSGQRDALRTVIFRTRYRSDTTETMRVTHDSDVYEVEAVREIGRREGLEIVATARVP